MINTPLITIGVISYNDKHYLEHNIPSLLNQSYENIEILICDNSPNDVTFEWIKKTYPQIKLHKPGGNLGFGKAHNYLIDQSQGEYYLCFNSDMVADNHFVENLVKGFEKDEKIACVTGKLLSWTSFPKKPNKETDTLIDTTGLILFQNHHVVDRGQGEKDDGRYDKDEEIWGASGAAPMFLKKALKDIEHSPSEYFDKDIFMYKEDIDLSYRLRWAGWKTWYKADAIAFHDRTASNAGGIIKTIQKRRKQSKMVKKQSFVNQFYFVYKNISPKYSFKTKLKTRLFQLKYLIYLFLFEPSILFEWKTYKKLKKVLKHKTMPRRISAQEMEAWMH